ncbi:LLM class flavin-dependent oxidoreductase [Alphaproteobacteria bacterium]|nr:LLM class flavin-dependent oxidoreductase [Alphaproteobacteria bacterium]
MRFSFFHLMPYGAVDLDAIKDTAWIKFSNSNYDPKEGYKLYNRYLDELEFADQLGYDGICVNEHHQTAYGIMPQPSVLAGALSRRTENAKICVLGRALPLTENPLSIAEEYSMIDNVTGGRLIAGFVRGIGCEYHSYMVNPSQSLERFHEAHDLILQAWTQPGPTAFEGKYYRFQYVNLWPRPYQQPHPPVWIPSQGSTETKDWASHPDRRYTLLMTFSPIKNVIRNMNAYAEKCEEYGYQCQPHQLGWALPLYVSETDEKAIKEARPHIENFFNKFVLAPTEFRMPPGYSSINSYKMIMENKMKLREQFLSIEMLMENGMFICGSPSTVAERLEGYQAEMGYGNLVTMGQFATLSHEQTTKSMQMFAEEVMPKLRHIGTSAAVAAE